MVPTVVSSVLILLLFSSYFGNQSCADGKNFSLEVGKTPEPPILEDTLLLKHMMRYVVALYSSEAYICNGVIITAVGVLTAANCVYDKEIRTMEGAVGNVNREKGDRVTFIGMNVHPQWNKGSGGFFDLAILILKKPITKRDFISPVFLSFPGIAFSGKTAFVVGWGRSNMTTEENPLSLMMYELPVLEFLKCTEYFSNIWTNQMCAGFRGKSACYIDAGAPLIYRRKGVDRLIGILSYNRLDCGSLNIPSVFSEIRSFILWIYDHSRKLD